jgi:polyhydroxyalkanoate synthesis regulator phasin
MTWKVSVKKLMLEKIKARLSNAVDESKLLRKTIIEKKGQLESLEEKFIMGEITKELYNKYSIRYNDEIQLLNSEFEKSYIKSSNFEKAVEKCLEIAQNISAAWVSAGFENKQRLQKLVYPEGIGYNKQEGVVRTSKINSLFSEIAPLARVVADMKKGNSLQNCLQSLPVNLASCSTNFLREDIDLILHF